MTELGRRAVACRGWRWLPGMAIRDEAGGRAVIVALERRGGAEWVVFRNPQHDTDGQVPSSWLLPDLNDPATRGCLLELVREAWGCAEARYLGDGPPGAMVVWAWAPGDAEGYGRGMSYFLGKTEAEALVRALEMAP